MKKISAMVYCTKEHMKWGLFVFNLILMIEQILTVVVGSLLIYHSFLHYLPFCATEVLLTPVCLCGIYIIFKERKYGLLVLAAIWALALLADIADMIILSKDMASQSRRQYELGNLFRKYRSDYSFDADRVDNVQESYSCCGWESYKDWATFVPWSDLHFGDVPDRCCIEYEYECGVGALENPSKIYTEGCEMFTRSINSLLILDVSVIAVSVALKMAAVVLFYKFSTMISRGQNQAIIHHNVAYEDKTDIIMMEGN